MLMQLGEWPQAIGEQGMVSAKDLFEQINQIVCGDHDTDVLSSSSASESRRRSGVGSGMSNGGEEFCGEALSSLQRQHVDRIFDVFVSDFHIVGELEDGECMWW
jgi:hypothetical protein